MTLPPSPATDAVAQSNVSFRHVLLLCLPALVLGIVLRVSFLVAIPEIFYGPDSNSYFETAQHLWTDGKIVLKPKRRYFYPFILTFTPLLPGSTAVGVAVLQHILGLAIVVGVGWIVAQMTRFHNLWVPIATCLVAVWPRMLWYEHEMVAEVWLLATFVAAVAIALPCGSLKDKRRLFWFLVALAAIVACKPHGRGIWVGLLVVAVVTTGNPLKWQMKSLAMLALSLLIMLTAGSSRQGSWLLLDTALPFVKTEGEPYAKYRAVLRPFVDEARADLPNYAENQGKYKKALSGKTPTIGSEWVALSNDQELYTKVVKRLAVEGIISHPLEYAKLVLRKIVLVGSLAQTRGASIHFSPEEFWGLQKSRFETPTTEVQLLYGLDSNDAFQRLAEDRGKRTTWIAPWMDKLGSSLTWTLYGRSSLGEPPNMGLTILGWLLALGLVGCLSPRHFVCRSLLWLPVVGYLSTTLGVGDALGRYLHPVEWVAIVIIVIGLDSVMTLAARAISGIRQERQSCTE